MRIGMAQILVEGGAYDANLLRAVDAVCDAAEAGCEMVVLPECLDAGWTDPSARSIASPVPGRTTDVLSSVAMTGNIWVVAGVTEKDGDRLYNTAVMISPQGSIVATHRKINELTIAHDIYSLGTSLQVVSTAFGKVGLTICADNAPESIQYAHALCRMGARLLPSPCAWAVDADHDNKKEPYGEMWMQAYSEVAESWGATVVGVSNVGSMTGGPWAGRKCIGCSLAVGPGGKVLATGPYNEEALIVFEAPVA